MTMKTIQKYVHATPLRDTIPGNDLQGWHQAIIAAGDTFQLEELVWDERFQLPSAIRWRTNGSPLCGAISSGYSYLVVVDGRRVNTVVYQHGERVSTPVYVPAAELFDTKNGVPVIKRHAPAVLIKELINVAASAMR